MQITSLFLGYYFRHNQALGIGKGLYGDKVSGMFFNGIPALFDKKDEKHISNGIQLWLKRLHLGNKKWLPILHIEEQKGWFLVNFPVINRKEPLEPPVTLQDFISLDKFEPVRYEVLRDLTGLSDLFPDIAYYLQSQGKHPIRFDSNMFVDVFTRILPMLRLMGIETMMPKSLGKILKPAPSLRISAISSGENPSFVNLQELLGFEYQVALGDSLVSVEEFKKLVGKLTGIVKIRDQYVLISNDMLEKLFEQLEKPVRLNPHELLKSALSEEYQGAKVELTPAVRKLISAMTSNSKLKLPEHLTATLRPYQLDGYRWMVKNSAKRRTRAKQLKISLPTSVSP
jgi:hypothetical protein